MYRKLHPMSACLLRAFNREFWRGPPMQWAMAVQWHCANANRWDDKLVSRRFLRMANELLPAS